MTAHECFLNAESANISANKKHKMQNVFANSVC